MCEPPRATGWPGRRMEGQRALAAAKDGDLATLKRLLEAGALGPGIVDALGAGLVHHAARAGRLACVKFLVRQAELPGSQRAHNGATPVHDAAATGSLAELRWLVRDGGCGLQVSGTAAGLGPVSAWIGGGGSRGPGSLELWAPVGTAALGCFGDSPCQPHGPCPTAASSQTSTKPL